MLWYIRQKKKEQKEKFLIKDGRKKDKWKDEFLLALIY